ncbi:hypothetical protein ORL60_14300 [Klebsiella michiganensis]|uniref:hypothetical protein n=1 Tax=Klebsiella michiganensis TaxID=1134687 RepID=UPI002246B0D4|nr:hypothetical protein [Klebsiella michiganensis]MCW9670430.1 hypothetical protein [Klebsiella michiganensis]
MTDITELAQREKFEVWAEHACAAPWGYLKKRRTTEGYSEQIYTCMWTAWKAAGAELVEALEKAQTEVKRQENIASALFDEVSQLRRNADDKAPELKKIITEMEEENNRQVLEVMRLSSLVAELESRTVTVKMPKPHAHLIWIQAGHAPDDYWDDVAVSHSEKDRCCDGSERYPVYARWEIEEMLTAAGIKWEAE